MERQIAPKARAARNPGTTIALGSLDFVHARAYGAAHALAAVEVFTEGVFR
jgi:hypothetical protein